MDISYCGDKTGFPRPGHKYAIGIYPLFITIYCENQFKNTLHSLWPIAYLYDVTNMYTRGHQPEFAPFNYLM